MPPTDGEDRLVIPLPVMPMVTVRPEAATVVLPPPSTVTIEIWLVLAVLPATSTAWTEICRSPWLSAVAVIVQLP